MQLKYPIVISNIRQLSLHHHVLYILGYRNEHCVRDVSDASSGIWTGSVPKIPLDAERSRLLPLENTNEGLHRLQIHI